MSTEEKGRDMQLNRTTSTRSDACSAALTAIEPAWRTRSLQALLVAAAIAALIAVVCLTPTQRAYAAFEDQSAFLLTDAYYSQDASSGTVYVARGDKDFGVSVDLTSLGPVSAVVAVSADNANVSVGSPYFQKWSGELSFRLAGNTVGSSTVTYQAVLEDGTMVAGALKTRVFDIDLGKRSFTGFNYVLYQSITATPKVTGLPKGTWRSSDTAVARVTPKGKISYKGLGACEVRGTFGPIEVVIPVDCTYKKAYQAVKNGFADANSKIIYSQGKRMAKNYRDCSSFVSRCFWDASLKRKIFAIGGTSGKNWALPAAEQAKWLNGQKKCVAKKGVSASRLLAGDTVYTQTNYAGVNNRYRNIDHAVLYVGAGLVLSTGGGSNRDIYLRAYYEDPAGTYVKFIGRPCAEPALNMSKATLTKKKGANHTAQLKMQWVKGKVKWSSSNKKVATVDAKGKVTAKKKGTAKISAKVGGKTYKCKITVK